jgi:hypothetical protein
MKVHGSKAAWKDVAEHATLEEALAHLDAITHKVAGAWRVVRVERVA